MVVVHLNTGPYLKARPAEVGVNGEEGYWCWDFLRLQRTSFREL